MADMIDWEPGVKARTRGGRSVRFAFPVTLLDLIASGRVGPEQGVYVVDPGKEWFGRICVTHMQEYEPPYQFYLTGEHLFRHGECVACGGEVHVPFPSPLKP